MLKTSIIRGRRAERNLDSGFTLIELVVAVTLVGMLSVAAMAGITSILRTVPANSRNIGESHDQDQLVNYFVPDVRSTGVSGVVASPAAGGCSGSDPGVNVVQLTWQRAGVTYRSSYRVITTNGASRLDRYLCSGATAANLGAAQVTNILDAIDPVPAGWAGGSSPAYVVLSSNVLTLRLTQSAVKRNLSIASTLRADLSTLP